MQKLLPPILLLAVALALGCNFSSPPPTASSLPPSGAPASPQPSHTPVPGATAVFRSFKADLLPHLVANCAECHSAPGSGKDAAVRSCGENCTYFDADSKTPRMANIKRNATAVAARVRLYNMPPLRPTVGISKADFVELVNQWESKGAPED